jgi:hypothetical protein
VVVACSLATGSSTFSCTHYTQKSGVSIGIAPSFSGYMTVVKVRDYPTERLLVNYDEFFSPESIYRRSDKVSGKSSFNGFTE